MKLVFATHNLNKIKEIKPLLPDFIEILSLSDIKCFEEIPETAETIAENAFLKTKYVKEKYGYNCFADDTGLEVDFLNGAPGVHSARYAGESKNDEENVSKLLMNLKNSKNRNARFKTVIALILGDEQKNFTGICEGKILTSARGTAGFGYDPIFQPQGKQQSFAEMTAEEKNEISHRAKATQQLIEYLQQNKLV